MWNKFEWFNLPYIHHISKKLSIFRHSFTFFHSGHLYYYLSSIARTTISVSWSDPQHYIAICRSMRFCEGEANARMTGQLIDKQVCQPFLSLYSIRNTIQPSIEVCVFVKESRMHAWLENSLPNKHGGGSFENVRKLNEKWYLFKI